MSNYEIVGELDKNHQFPGHKKIIKYLVRRIFPEKNTNNVFNMPITLKEFYDIDCARKYLKFLVEDDKIR